MAAVVTIGGIHDGVRSNIIPEEVEMIGTIRALNSGMQQQIHSKIRQIVDRVAAGMGATASVEILMSTQYPVTYNAPKLITEMLPTLQRVAGEESVTVIDAITGAEDFSFYAKEVPGFFFFLGGKPKNVATDVAPKHHSPDFYIDESAMKIGVTSLANLAIDYLNH